MFGHLLGTSAMAICQMNNGQMNGGQIGAAGRAVLRAGQRAGAILLVAGLAACSTAPDWARPSLIYGDDATAAAADASEDKDFPQLADVPDKPVGGTTAEERQQVTEGLAADRERARYSDETLRGGTETPAPAPRSANPVPVPTIAAIPAAPAISAENAEVSPESGIIPAPARGGRALPGHEVASQVDAPATRSATTTDVSVAPVAAPARAARAAAPSPAAPVAAAEAAAVERPRVASAPVQPARRAAAVPALPESERRVRAEVDRTIVDERVSAVNAAAVAVQSTAAAVVAPVNTAAAAVAASTTYPGDRFEPSSAPALTNEALEAAGPVVSSRYGAPSAVIGSADPEDPVQVNMDALLGIPGPGASLEPANGVEVPAIYANQGGPGNIPPYVVNFGHGSVHLTSADQQIIAQAAKAVVDLGGVIRIVGHASSRTSDLDVGKHLLANFRVSLDRATAVANALIRSGVDPSRVFVEAKSDAVPVYYESMPAGEAGNRRAEIFIE